MTTTSDIKKEKRKDILLSIFQAFPSGERGISLSTIQDSVQQFQLISELGYSFSERFRYSYELMEDLKSLIYYGLIREYSYRHDSFLPKKYYELTPLGGSRGKKLIQELPPDQREELKKVVATAIENHQKRWRLWTRYEQED